MAATTKSKPSKYLSSPPDFGSAGNGIGSESGIGSTVAPPIRSFDPLGALARGVSRSRDAITRKL